MRWLVLIILVILLSAGITSARELSNYVGDWAGDLEPGSGILLHVTEEDGSGRVVIGDAGATHTGLQSEGGREISASFVQNVFSFELALVKRAAPPERQTRPQEPGVDRPYHEEEITFTASDGVELAGTLILPEGKGPFPAVVLLNGSGPQDRDEYLVSFNHKPFLVLSDYLARAGIASFRYDDRGVGASGGAFMPTHIEVFAEDAARAFNLLAEHPETGTTGYLGHSEGGLSAALAFGTFEAKPDFIVTLAGPYKKVSEILIEQASAIAEAEGYDLATVNLARTQQQLFVSAVLNAKRPEDACPLLELYSAGAPQNQREQLLQFCTPYFWSLMRTDPVPALQAYKGPVLALFGGLDKQVLAAAHAPIAQEILQDGEVITIEGKNHLFQTAETGAMSEYGQLEESMSAEVMSKMAVWIHAR